MKDTSDNAIKLATAFFEKGAFKATRWCPGAMKGEWMVVDDKQQRLVVVQLDNAEEEQVLDGYDYEFGVARHGAELSNWMDG